MHLGRLGTSGLQVWVYDGLFDLLPYSWARVHLLSWAHAEVLGNRRKRRRVITSSDEEGMHVGVCDAVSIRRTHHNQHQRLCSMPEVFGCLDEIVFEMS